MQVLIKVAAMFVLSAPLALVGCVGQGADDALDETVQPEAKTLGAEITAPNKMTELPSGNVQGSAGMLQPAQGLAQPPSTNATPSFTAPSYSAPTCGAP